MNRDKISAFTLKITSSNGSELISILYDIYSEYEYDAIEEFKAGQVNEAIAALKKCAEVVSHLQRDLNFEGKWKSVRFVRLCAEKHIKVHL